MTLTTLSLCAAAALSLSVAEAPSQPRDLRMANSRAVSDSAGASAKPLTAPTGAKLILAGIRRG